MPHKLRRILKTGTYMTRRLKAGAEVSFIPEAYGKIFDKIKRTELVVPNYEAPREEAPKRRGRPPKATKAAKAAADGDADDVDQTADDDADNDAGGDAGEGNSVGVTGTADLAPPAEPEQEDAQEDPRTKLRALYEKVFGKKPFMGWSADDLKKKIEEESDKE
jgi:hypothetical protein